jgi:TnpA family transposase
MKRKYTQHYRQILPLILENITFRSDNRFQPVVEALSTIKRYLGTNYQHFPEDVPLKGVVSKSWEKVVLEEIDAEQKVNRKYYEICVLEKLERALKCKEIWVENAQDFRNPNDDLPQDWNNDTTRFRHYETLKQPIEVKSFIDPIKEQMTKALTEFNKQISNSNIVRIITPGRSAKALFSVTKLEAQDKPKSLELIKETINRSYGMLDLLDIFAEADRMVDFTSFFTHSGTKEVRSRQQLRPLIILSLFGEGTNLGVKRVAKAQEKYSYDELHYVRKTYFSIEALRNAIAAVVNKILQLRNPRIWGEANSCASDGKHFQSWQQNLQAEFRTRYKGYGVMVYWHVETNAVCIYSKLKTYSNSEVAAMIEGLIRHDTEMRVEKNFVDSHGQSEVAFAFCRLLGDFRLMPRLKRIKYERLYLPDSGMTASFPNLSGVLTRPIRWDLVEPQYDEIMKSTVALKQGYASAEAILRRFNSYNVVHPTYKALIELGKAEKTIFLCEYLPSLPLQREINEGLNVVENWNSAADFIHYGKGREIATNNRENQEISLLSLHLLQNCLVLINTILVEQIIEEKKMLEKLSLEDLRALTPLFYSHINPYGTFELDLEKPSFLKVA